MNANPTLHNQTQGRSEKFVWGMVSPVTLVLFLPFPFPLYPRLEVARQIQLKRFGRALLAPSAGENDNCSH